MTRRTDVTVNYALSPRLITVAAPSVALTLQDAVDTLRAVEDDPRNGSEPVLINASGKEDLGGGVAVGVTAELQNAQISFQSRFAPITTGTVTTQDTAGETCIAAAETYITDGVARGDIVHNHLDGSHATVLTVDSEIQLTTTVLEGGSDNQYDIGDEIIISEVVQCNISGGNLVAVDSVDVSMDPVFPTYGTQVVRTSSSSATLQELQDIQFASFAGGVWVDVAGGTAGTTFPTGTERQPVDNFTDALAIQTVRGFNTFFIIGDATVDAGLDYTNAVFVGQGQNLSVITITSAAVVLNSTFENAEVTGTLDGDSRLADCIITNLDFVSGVIEACILSSGTITLGGSQTAHLINCTSGVPGVSTPMIDMGGNGQPLALRNYNGGIEITNKTGTDSVSIDLNSGQIILASDVTNGTIVCRGVGKLTDNSVGATVVNELINLPAIADNVWLEALEGTFTAEQLMRLAAAGHGADVSISGGVAQIKDLANSKNRIVANVDDAGNRTVTSRDLT